MLHLRSELVQLLWRGQTFFSNSRQGRDLTVTCHLSRSGLCPLIYQPLHYVISKQLIFLWLFLQGSVLLSSSMLLCRGSSKALVPSVSRSPILSRTRALFCRRSTVLLTTDMSELFSSEGPDTPGKPDKRSTVKGSSTLHHHMLLYAFW